MKTNASLKIFKFSTLVPLGIAIAAAFVSPPVFGNHQLVFTENSSLSLSATFDGASLTVSPVHDPLGGVIPDKWDVTLPTGVSRLLDLPLFWFEPGTTSSTNATDLVRVDSEFALLQVDAEPDGFTYIGVTTDTSDNILVDVTFHDNGDTASVPDTGSTLGLLFLSVIALFGLNRLRQSQLA